MNSVLMALLGNKTIEVRQMHSDFLSVDDRAGRVSAAIRPTESAYNRTHTLTNKITVASSTLGLGAARVVRARLLPLPHARLHVAIH
jgi:hypothetical protein